MTDDLVDELDEWGYDKRRSVEYITHDSGTAQFEIDRDSTDRSYKIRFEFEGGTDFVEARAYDTRQADTQEDVKNAVIDIIARFEDEIDERYYTQAPDEIELHIVGDDR